VAWLWLHWCWLGQKSVFNFNALEQQHNSIDKVGTAISELSISHSHKQDVSASAAELIGILLPRPHLARYHIGLLGTTLTEFIHSLLVSCTQVVLIQERVGCATVVCHTISSYQPEASLFFNSLLVPFAVKPYYEPRHGEAAQERTDV